MIKSCTGFPEDVAALLKDFCSPKAAADDRLADADVLLAEQRSKSIFPDRARSQYGEREALTTRSQKRTYRGYPATSPRTLAHLPGGGARA